MAEKKGCQTPTQSVILDFSKSYGSEARKYYEESGRKLITWQARLVRNIMGTDKTGLWVHQKFGFFNTGKDRHRLITKNKILNIWLQPLKKAGKSA